MESGHGHEHAPLSPEDALARVERMVRAGRISEDDGNRLSVAATAGGFDEAVAEVRRKHAAARVADAVDAGRMSAEDAEVLLARLDGGEDPRHVLRGVRTVPVRPSDGGADSGEETGEGDPAPLTNAAHAP